LGHLVSFQNLDEPEGSGRTTDVLSMAMTKLADSGFGLILF
jgi:hypothetical protein